MLDHSNVLYTWHFNLRACNFLLGSEHSDSTLRDPKWNNYDKFSVIFNKLFVKILSYIMEAA